MPNAVVKSYAKQTGKSKDTVEKNWDKGKQAAKDAGLEPGSDEFYAYTNAVTKKMSGVKEDEEDNKKGSKYTPFFQTQGYTEGILDSLKKKLGLIQHEITDLKFQLKVDKSKNFRLKQDVEAKKKELKKKMQDLMNDKKMDFMMKDELFSAYERAMFDLNNIKENTVKKVYKPFFEKTTLTETSQDMQELLNTLSKMVKAWNGENPPYMDDMYIALGNSLDEEAVDAIDSILMRDDFDKSHASETLTRMLKVAYQRHGTEPDVAASTANGILMRFLRNHK